MYELVYTSLLAESSDAPPIAALLGTARRRNAGFDVTGLLLFDGRRFLGCLEGGEQAVGGLSVLIAADRRHTGFEIRHEGEYAMPRRFDGCALAYARLLPGTPLLDRLAQLQGPPLMDGLLALLPGLELQRG